MTRFWHGFTAHYNTYYNGTLAYIDASLEKENGNKDNYTEQIPLYTVSNKASRELGKGKYEAAITKAQKAIQLHSIKAKPEWKKSRRKTESDIEWLTRKEYNPFLWKAWMLMGRSQFYKGDFDAAAATFTYMSRLYKGQPAIYGKARAWLAKCYIENDWLYDAEDVIRNMQRDSIDWRAQKEWDYTLCDYYLHAGDYTNASKYLRRVIRHEMRSKQKAREYYLLGQIEAAQGHREEAYQAFRKVVRQNPSYELAFNARISMTEVMAKGQSKKMIGKLRRMAHNENNKEYLDQVYYAIGNIYLAEKDTMNAIAAYEKGNEKATRTGIEKGVLLLHLGDLYWAKEKYGDAQRVYGQAIGMLDKERPDYKQLAERSKVLDKLAPYTDAIYLQDSLQVLAKMPEKERNAAIDRVITALKKKEKEEQAKAAEEEAAKRQQKYGNNSAAKTPQKPVAPQPAGKPGSNVWYFYNTQAVQQGKQTFQRQWGKRENVDNWQRYNKTVVGDFASGDDDNPDMADLSNMTPEQKDSVMKVMEAKEKEEAKKDTAANDPHKREYYLAQIPFTEEQMAASHDIIKDGLLHSAIIFKDNLDNLPLSEKQFARLLKDYPDFDPKDEIYYHLFLLYSRKGNKDLAQQYVTKLKGEYPDSKWTIVVTDPYFAENARYGTHLEDSIYGATYEAFKNDNYKEVYRNAEISETRFPLGANRDRFIFLDGLTRLNDGDAEACVAAMEKVVKDYPTSAVAEMAGMIVNGVKNGKQLHGAKFDLSDVWNRRSVVLDDAGQYAERTFSEDKNTDFVFFIAYAPDSLNENQLLFQMAKFNFTSFMVRSFDIDIEELYGMHHMTVRGFRNFDEARQYSKILLQRESINNIIGNSGRPVIISKENLELIGTKYSYNDYDTFYVAHFAPLPVERPEQLYEQVQVKPVKKEPARPADGEEAADNDGSGTDDENAGEASSRRPVDDDDDPVTPFLPTEDVVPNGVKPVDPNEKKAEEEPANDDNAIAMPADNDIAIPDDNAIAMPSDDGITIPEDKGGQTTEEDDIVITDDSSSAANEDDTIIITDGGDSESAEEDTIIITDDSNGSQETDEDVIIMTDGDDKKADSSEDVIVIEDDNEKKSTKDLEDEYFELDGF